MTKEEIKHTYSMTDIVERYGFRPNRAGFVSCPFHKGDNTASMKIYKDSFHCYGCGENGDVFKFVMLIEHISFKDAFLSLGGTYDRPGNERDEWHRQRNLKLLKQQQERKQQELLIRKKRIRELSDSIGVYQTVLKCWKPFSPEWCVCMTELCRAFAEYDCLREEVSKN